MCSTFGEEVKVLLSAAKAQNLYAVRALAFDGSGSYLLASTDAKLVYVWETKSWELLNTIKLPKRATSVAFTGDNQYWLVSDKYGDVLAAPLAAVQKDLQPTVLLGHCSSILTSISVSSCGGFIASADRDHKIRVSRLPEGTGVAAGAPHIQSFCLGHTDYVTSVAFLQRQGSLALVSGSGDGTVKLWDPKEGTLLASLDLPAAPEAIQPAPATEADSADTDTVLSLTPLPGSSRVAVLVDGRHSVHLMALDWETHTLSWVGAPLDLTPAQPTAAAVDGDGRLWLVSGPAGAAGVGAAITLATLGSGAAELQVATHPPDTLPLPVWEELQGDTSGVGETRHLLAHLAKVPPSEDEVAFRKRQRRDLN